MKLHLRSVTEVVHKHFGKTFDEAAKQQGERIYEYFNEERYPWGVHLTDDNRTGDGTVAIGFKGHTALIQFTLSYYPACCGTMLFHSFYVNESKVSQAQLDEIMTTFFQNNLDFLRGSNRIEVMMVECRYGDKGGYAHTSPLDDPEPVENPKIKYKSLWNFFHKHSRRVRTRLEVNKNTSNVLHNMEVIF
jgi:hypothetical protein